METKNAFDVLMKRHKMKDDDHTIEEKKNETEKVDAISELMKTSSHCSTQRRSLPKGLMLKFDVVHNGREIIKCLRETSGWSPVGSAVASRRVLHFGYIYNYSSGIKKELIKSSIPIPDFLQPLNQIAKDLTGISFDQCLVNEYLPGQGISRHIDKSDLFGGTVACFSVGSSAIIQFRHPSTEECIDVAIPENSLYVMQGEARYVWTHEMPARLRDGTKYRSTRYSITFRHTKI